MATSWGFCTPLELRKLKFVGKRRGGVGKVVDNRAESSDLLFTVCIHRCHDGQDNNSEKENILTNLIWGMHLIREDFNLLLRKYALVLKTPSLHQNYKIDSSLKRNEQFEIFLSRFSAMRIPVSALLKNRVLQSTAKCFSHDTVKGFASANYRFVMQWPNKFCVKLIDLCGLQLKNARSLSIFRF